MNTISDGILAARVGSAFWETDLVVRQDFSFPPEFVGFAGHFPGEPILPAVVQIGTGVVLAKSFPVKGTGPCRLEAVTRAKFLRKLKPGEIITAQCVRRGPGGRTFDVVLAVGRQQAATFTLSFTSTSTSQPGDPADS